MTAGFTGADLENLVNEAALLAGRKGKSTVSYSDFEAAVLRTIAGIEKETQFAVGAREGDARARGWSRARRSRPSVD